MDNMSSLEEVNDAIRGAAFIRNFSDDDFQTLRRLGPVRSIIEAAVEKTLEQTLPILA